MVLGLFSEGRSGLQPTFNSINNFIPETLNRLNTGLGVSQDVSRLANQGLQSSLPKLNLFGDNGLGNLSQRQTFAENFANINRQALERPFRDNVSYINNLLTNAGLGASSMNIDAQNRHLENYINKYGELLSQGQLAFDDMQQNKVRTDILGLQALGGLTGQYEANQQNLINALLNSLANQERNAAAADQTKINLLNNLLGGLFS